VTPTTRYANRRSTAASTYTATAATTLTPANLLVMCYDALVTHMDVAATAIDAGDLAQANDRLVKAQALLFELETSLDTTVWAAAQGLADLYGFIGQQLVAANLDKDTARVRACRDLIAPLADAWRQAAQEAPDAGRTPTALLSVRS
jgi:flagellar protein FliS